LYENPWKIIISLPDESIIFSYSQLISLMINGKWESIEKTLSIKNISKKEVSLILELTNKDTVKFNIILSHFLIESWFLNSKFDGWFIYLRKIK